MKMVENPILEAKIKVIKAEIELLVLESGMSYNEIVNYLFQYVNKIQSINIKKPPIVFMEVKDYPDINKD